MNQNELKQIREFLIEQPLKIADDIDEILSLSFVGSFSENYDLSDISDIDIVIIVDFLTKPLFERILSRFELIEIPLSKKYGVKLKINSFLGPLKFNEENTVVYHVMVYDVCRHILHCRKSPFTCYDWERTNLYKKSHLSQIYSIYRLMPSYFFSARRGADEYLKDITNNTISYRKYEFTEDGEAIEKLYHKQMTIKDKYEFAFHIVRFLMLNFIKLIESKNVFLTNEDIINRFKYYLPGIDNNTASWFSELYNFKKNNQYPEDTKDIDLFTKNFITQFEKYFHEYFLECDKYIYFCRHGRTEINKGTLFLGQRLNPHIIRKSIIAGKNMHEFEGIFVSPSQRSIETALLITSCKDISIDPLLNEINYGKAEGKDLEWLNRYYPEIIRAWTEGRDIAFPSGESLNDVKLRVEKFLSIISRHNKILVVTHNVWLRVLIGTYFGIPTKDWYKINIPYSYLFKFSIGSNGKLYPSFEEEDLKILFNKLECDNLKTFYKSYDPNIEERYTFWSTVYEQKEEINSKIHNLYDCDCLIPMAGEGARFKNEGFTIPKPLINVDGNYMIFQTINCLPKTEKIVYIVKDNILSDSVKNTLASTADDVEIVSIQKLTEGQACTCLAGMHKINLSKPLLVAPCDNGMIWEDEKFISLINKGNDIICWTFTKHLTIKHKPEAWGYVKIDEEDNAINVSVKKPFSDDPYSEHCIIGTFWFRSGKLFRDLAEELIASNLRVNNEFYVDSIIGLAIKKGNKVKVFDVDKYISWGKPEDLFEYNKWMNIMNLLNIEGM